MNIVASKELTEKIRQQVVEELDVAPSAPTHLDFAEIGTTGLRRFGGTVYEEFLPNLQWPRAGKVYLEMASNDPVIGAVLYICEQLIRRASWRVEAGGENPVDIEAREFLASCLDDMSMPWSDLIAEILSMITYGFSWHEEVYKKREGDVRDPTRRSKYNDGRIGWRKLPGRAQHTVHEWVFDPSDDGGLLGMIQIAPPDYKRRVIPLEKSLLFRARVASNNPEGRSLLRNAYRSWYYKKHIEEIEGIGIERDLAGLPLLVPPEGIDIWDTEDPDAARVRNTAEKLVRNIRRDQNEGIVMPFGWTLTLLNTGSRRQFDTSTIINRYDQRIAITLLADLVMLGGDKVGSFALADVKKSMLGASLEAILDSIASVFNRVAIPRLFRLNAFPGIHDYPTLVPGEVITPTLTELARYIQVLAACDMPLFPDDNLEEYLRNIAGMPARADTARPVGQGGGDQTRLSDRVVGNQLSLVPTEGDDRLGNAGASQEEVKE